MLSSCLSDASDDTGSTVVVHWQVGSGLSLPILPNTGKVPPSHDELPVCQADLLVQTVTAHSRRGARAYRGADLAVLSRGNGGTRRSCFESCHLLELQLQVQAEIQITRGIGTGITAYRYRSATGTALQYPGQGQAPGSATGNGPDSGGPAPSAPMAASESG